jgi:hypothetical protein
MVNKEKQQTIDKQQTTDQCNLAICFLKVQGRH